MVEFALNSSANQSTGFSPFELIQGSMPRMITSLPADENKVPGVKQFAERALQNLRIAHDAIIDSRIQQTHFANRHRRDETVTGGEVLPIQSGDQVYLSTTRSKRR